MSTQFDTSAFQQKLTTQWIGQSLTYFEELESTNSYVKSLPADKIDHGMLCVTDNQTQGRGQYEREWESESGQNLTFSLVFKPQARERFHVLTLACALAIVDQLQEIFNDPQVCIKWPNDVLLNGKKVAGLLTETMFAGNKLDRLVIGIGMNVNQTSFSPGISSEATSVQLKKGHSVEREPLLSNLLRRIEYKYNLWQRQHRALIKGINRNIVGYGQWVGLKVNGELKKNTFKMLGINEKGQLLMLNQDGGIESFSYEQIRLITD
ncbi:biotin--[acetyl-CoA-carboxylase] ligase [Fodinibius halophilus]|uniref:Biotin--[acetyl-CoA-carboxylase] ligase n=1 Tax=Fodinibius halophilus TaxID=1736908 RepID=A0A6M1TI89_9BACT|nr:biotin--[acetyl-CoA-carboxylase] ligase [Fodinibius halophilus]NGP89782.1 biotin--[acetyl-CoA-carboxylase] ligase [Fodinibius halophilus]